MAAFAIASGQEPGGEPGGKGSGGQEPGSATIEQQRTEAQVASVGATPAAGLTTLDGLKAYGGPSDGLAFASQVGGKPDDESVSAKADHGKGKKKRRSNSNERVNELAFVTRSNSNERVNELAFVTRTLPDSLGPQASFT